LRRLERGFGAEERTAVRRQGFQVQDVRSVLREPLEQSRFSGTGEPGNDVKSRLLADLIEMVPDMLAVGAISAGQDCHFPANFSKHDREAAGTMAAAPAVHKRPIIARLPSEVSIEMTRDIPHDERRSHLARGKGILRIQGANFVPFSIIEHRQVD
jgi:hypothetical protein